MLETFTLVRVSCQIQGQGHFGRRSIRRVIAGTHRQDEDHGVAGRTRFFQGAVLFQVAVLLQDAVLFQVAVLFQGVP